jgi:hypothetical protein
MAPENPSKYFKDFSTFPVLRQIDPSPYYFLKFAFNIILAQDPPQRRKEKMNFPLFNLSQIVLPSTYSVALSSVKYKSHYIL